jgi:hypothetical protein
MVAMSLGTISAPWHRRDVLLGLRLIIQQTTEASGTQARFSRRGVGVSLT